MASEKTTEQLLREQVTGLQRELAFYFGQHHGTLGHQMDALSCTVNDCVRVRNLCLSTDGMKPKKVDHATDRSY